MNLNAKIVKHFFHQVVIHGFQLTFFVFNIDAIDWIVSIGVI